MLILITSALQMRMDKEAMYGNARLDTIEKMAVALSVSVKSLFEPMGDETVEGFIKIRGKIYQFNCRSELENLLNCKR